MRYGTDPLHERHSVPLDSLIAIYHRRSGQTHLVTSPVPEILAALRQGDADIGELLRRLDIKDSAATRVSLEARLAELIATGLAFAA